MEPSQSYCLLPSFRDGDVLRSRSSSAAKPGVPLHPGFCPPLRAPALGVGSGSGVPTAAAIQGGCVHGATVPQEPSACLMIATQITSPSRAPKSPDAPESAQSEEEVDELSLIDHSEIMARLTLKQEVSASQALAVCEGRPTGGGVGFRENVA